MNKQTTDVLASILNDYVLVKKEDVDRLLKQVDNSIWVDFSALEEMTGLSRSKLDTILKRYRDELDVMHGGPVKYPDGGRWSINKDEMKTWLKDNHSRVWADDSIKTL